MSARVSQIIEVIEEVRNTYLLAPSGVSITQIRINAAHSVAARRSIAYNTVIDKFIRQLKPNVANAEQFDVLLKSWLLSNSKELQDIVLRHTADAHDESLIRNAFHKAPDQDILLSAEFGIDANDSEFQEGREKLLVHLVKERNRQLVAFAKEMWLKNDNTGDLKCSICSFSFAAAYGDFGRGYIEAHHMTPISEITENTIVRPADLAPVCSNCHGIIHRYRPWLTIEQMQQIVASRAGASTPR